MLILTNVHTRGRVFRGPSGTVCLAPEPGDYSGPNRTPAESRTQNVRIGLSRGIGSYQTAFFQRQSHILGRMHLTGVRSGVRQSETKRTGMRRRSLADAPFKTKARAFMKDNMTHKLTTVYPHRVGVAD